MKDPSVLTTGEIERKIKLHQKYQQTDTRAALITIPSDETISQFCLESKKRQTVLSPVTRPAPPSVPMTAWHGTHGI